MVILTAADVLIFKTPLVIVRSLCDLTTKPPSIVDSYSPPFSQSVTHVVSENNSSEEVRQWLDSQAVQSCVHLLAVSWFTESMRAGQPVDILDRHKLQVQFVSHSHTGTNMQRRVLSKVE